MKKLVVSIPTPRHPVEDACQWIDKNKTIIAAVADGVTRDLVAGKYPQPSPAKIAADLFCEIFVENLKSRDSFSSVALKNSFVAANQAIAQLNKKKIKKVDYAQNDYWTCVAVGAVIALSNLHWAFIGDSGVCVYDKLGKLKYRTPDDVLAAKQYINQIFGKYSGSNFKQYVRKTLRNSKKFVGGRMVSYGALTGEKEALNFIKSGSWTIEPGDNIILYTDGAEELIYSKVFIQKLNSANLQELKTIIRGALLARSKKDEATILIFKF